MVLKLILTIKSVFTDIYYYDGTTVINTVTISNIF